jgi:hypothetical protein
MSMLWNRQRFGFIRNILAAVLIVVIFVAPALSQDVATGTAVANVLASLMVVATQNLDFQDVLPGVAKIQDQTSDALSGIFTISGAPDREISMYIWLPDYLATVSGDDRLLVSFASTMATLDASVPALIGIDPHNLPDIELGPAGGTNPGECRIYLGGKVTPSVDQGSGAYSGDITLTVSYTGN